MKNIKRITYTLYVINFMFIVMGIFLLNYSADNKLIPLLITTFVLILFTVVVTVFNVYSTSKLVKASKNKYYNKENIDEFNKRLRFIFYIFLFGFIFFSLLFLMFGLTPFGKTTKIIIISIFITIDILLLFYIMIKARK